MDFAPVARRARHRARSQSVTNPIRHAAQHVVEQLEERRLLAIALTDGELVVQGSFRRNNIISVDLSRDGATYGVRVNAERQTFNAADVKSLEILGGRYHDYIAVGKYTTLGADIYGGWGNDTIIGGQGNDQVYELGGGNRIYTQGGDDYIFGGVGDDIVYGGYGNDMFFGNGGIDRMFGEFDDDYFDGVTRKNFAYGGPGNDKAVNASYIRDVEDYPGAPGTRAAASGTFRLSNRVLTVTGLSNANNVFNIGYSDSTNKYISVTVGTTKQFYLSTELSQIRVVGGTRNDLVQVSSSITLPMAIDTLAGSDTVYAGSGNDTINGGDGNDRISGGKGNDLISGGEGNDTIYGDAGNDSISGNNGDDRLHGGAGRDMIDAGGGNDYVDGGADYDLQRDGETIRNIEGTLTTAITGGSGGSGTTPPGGGTTTPPGGGTTTPPGGGTTTPPGGGTTTPPGGGTTTPPGGGTTTPPGGGTTTPPGGGTTTPPGGGGSSSGGGGYTGGGNNGGTTAGGGIITNADSDATAPKPVAYIYALQTTINAGQSIFVHGTNSVLKAGTPITARYEWDFGDPNGHYNKLVGFNAAHTYDTPGTYTLKLRVINELRGATEVTATITVKPASRQVLYVSAAGSDSNDGTSQSKAVKTWARAAQLVTGRGDVEILFRRGDTFDAKNTLSIGKNNVRIGAYGTGNDPTIRWAGARNTASMILINDGVIGSMIDDLTFDSIWPGPTGDRSGMPTGVKVNGYGNSIRGCTFLNVGYAIQTNGKPTGVLVQECEAPSQFALRNYLVWGEGAHFVLLGNKVVNSAVEHAVRISGVEHLLIAFGDYDNPKIYDFETPKQALNIQFANYVTVYGNRLAGLQQIGPLGGADGLSSKNERLTNVVFEGNHMDQGFVRIYHGTENLMLSNNVFEYDADAHIIIDGFSSEYNRGSKNINIINNTGINSGAVGRFIYVGGSVNQINVINNVYKADKMAVGSYATSAVYVTGGDMSSFGTIANNVWPVPASVTNWIKFNTEGGTGVHILGSPNRTSSYYNIDEWNALSQVLTDYQQTTPLSSIWAPSGSSIAASNGAKYRGIFADYHGNPRPLNAAWSVGAVEV